LNFLSELFFAHQRTQETQRGEILTDNFDSRHDGYGQKGTNDPPQPAPEQQRQQHQERTEASPHAAGFDADPEYKVDEGHADHHPAAHCRTLAASF
jgi:hypothetical protein